MFRFFVRTRPLSRIFDANLCVLSEPIGLSMLKLRCLPFSPYESDGEATTKTTTIFIKLDLLRLSTKLADGNVRTIVRRMDNKPVQLESATEQNLCFYVSNLGEEEEGKGLTTAISNCVGWTDVWLGKTYVPDFPEWEIVPRNVGRTPESRIDQQQEAGDAKNASIADKLQLKLLWKASVIRGDGTVHTVFGELIKYSCQNE
uniref:Uncharacterized protein n=1 Tax=Globodera pallida TaxID=36090 RepID=A0A183CMM7_GLOPA